MNLDQHHSTGSTVRVKNSKDQTAKSGKKQFEKGVIRKMVEEHGRNNIRATRV